jgi:hypothetical protein
MNALSVAISFAWAGGENEAHRSVIPADQVSGFGNRLFASSLDQRACSSIQERSESLLSD